jgi:hypothetical protein
VLIILALHLYILCLVENIIVDFKKSVAVNFRQTFFAGVARVHVPDQLQAERAVRREDGRRKDGQQKLKLTNLLGRSETPSSPPHF